jgi:hypothetical protein
VVSGKWEFIVKAKHPVEGRDFPGGDWVLRHIG